MPRMPYVMISLVSVRCLVKWHEAYVPLALGVLMGQQQGSEIFLHAMIATVTPYDRKELPRLITGAVLFAAAKPQA